MPNGTDKTAERKKKFKVGDYVFFIKNHNIGRWPGRDRNCKIGDIGKIFMGVVKGRTGYGVTLQGGKTRDIWYFEEDELEFVKYREEWEKTCLRGIKS